MYTYILQDKLLLTFKKNLEDLIFHRINFWISWLLHGICCSGAVGSRLFKFRSFYIWACGDPQARHGGWCFASSLGHGRPWGWSFLVFQEVGCGNPEVQYHPIPRMIWSSWVFPASGFPGLLAVLLPRSLPAAWVSLSDLQGATDWSTMDDSTLPCLISMGKNMNLRANSGYRTFVLLGWIWYVFIRSGDTPNGETRTFCLLVWSAIHPVAIRLGVTGQVIYLLMSITRLSVSSLPERHFSIFSSWNDNWDIPQELDHHDGLGGFWWQNEGQQP